MIIYLLIGAILTVVTLILDNTNPVGERLIDNLGRTIVFVIVVDIISWPLMVAFVIKGIVEEFTK